MKTFKFYALLFTFLFLFGMGATLITPEQSRASGSNPGSYYLCNNNCYEIRCHCEETCQLSHYVIGSEYYKYTQNIDIIGCDGPYDCDVIYYGCGMDCCTHIQ